METIRHTRDGPPDAHNENQAATGELFEEYGIEDEIRDALREIRAEHRENFLTMAATSKFLATLSEPQKAEALEHLREQADAGRVDYFWLWKFILG